MLSKRQIDQYERDGYLVIENFINQETCQNLLQECDRIIEAEGFLKDIQNVPVFFPNKHFLDSSDKIKAFLEHTAKDILATEEPSKKMFNKIGHGLHALNPVFKQVTFDSKVKNLFHSIGYKKPVVCQSMLIFKNPGIGSDVKPHQDSIYMLVEPQKILGVWIALEDCTLENGCLQFIPGSHKNVPLTTRLIRNPNKEEFDSEKCLIYTNGRPKDLNFDQEKFVPVPVKAGDAILIDGMVVHMSGPNPSPNSRNIYTFHVYESDNATFLKENWMEYNSKTFIPLYN